jgi:hypothetical protein
VHFYAKIERMKLPVYTLLLILLFIVSLCGYTQVSPKDSVIQMPLFNVSYAHQFPFGQMGERFGNNSNLGWDFLFKTKQNWVWGINMSFLFGNNLKETDILDELKTNQGHIIDADGKYALVVLSERGYSYNFMAGKLFPLFSPNPNSGIVFTAGPGFLQHKIKIDNPGNSAPQLNSEYIKGYDRLSNGFALKSFAGYYYLSNYRLINFFAGIEFTYANTKNRREYNYDKKEYDKKNYTDMLLGIRAGWVLPLYKKTPRNFYFY